VRVKRQAKEDLLSFNVRKDGKLISVRVLCTSGDSYDDPRMLGAGKRLIDRKDVRLEWGLSAQPLHRGIL